MSTVSTTSRTKRSLSGAWPFQQAVVHGPVQQVQRDLHLRARGKLAAPDGPAEDLPDLLPPRLQEPLTVLGPEHRVGLRLGEQGGDHPAVRPAARQPGPRAQHRQQVTAQRPGVPGLRGGRGPLGVERVQGQRFLGRPPAVDGGLADPGPFGDRVHADLRQAAGQQQFRGGPEDRLAGPLTAGPSPLRGPGGDVTAHAASSKPGRPWTPAPRIRWCSSSSPHVAGPASRPGPRRALAGRGWSRTSIPKRYYQFRDLERRGPYSRE